MTQHTITPLILAAGKGTRLKSRIPKPIFPLNGTPMLVSVLHMLRSSSRLTPAVIVVGAEKEQVRKVAGEEYTCVTQMTIDGTAGAVRAALPALPETGVVVVLYADHPFIQVESIHKLIETHTHAQASVSLFTVTVPHFADEYSMFSHFGRVVRGGGGEIKRIVEYKNATEKEREIKELNTGVYCIDSVFLRNALPMIEKNAETHEYYLTDIVEIAMREEKRVATAALAPSEAVGINSRDDIAAAKKLRQGQ